MRDKNLLKEVFLFLSVCAHTLCEHACVGGMFMHLVGNLFFRCGLYNPSQDKHRV